MSEEQLGNQTTVEPIPSTPPPAEKLYTAAEVEDIRAATAARVTATQRKKAMRALEIDDSGSSQQTIAHNVPSKEQLQKMVEEVADKKVNQIREQEIANFNAQRQNMLDQQLSEKLEKGAHLAKEKGIEDYDSVIRSLPFYNMPRTKELANEFENAHEIFYEMGKDQLKADELERLCHFNPIEARNRMQKLSESIRQNDKASKLKIPNAPLQQIRPSPVKQLADSGELTVADHRARQKARRRV